MGHALAQAGQSGVGARLKALRFLPLCKKVHSLAVVRTTCDGRLCKAEHFMVGGHLLLTEPLVVAAALLAPPPGSSPPLLPLHNVQLQGLDCTGFPLWGWTLPQEPRAGLIPTAAVCRTVVPKLTAE